MRNFYEHSFSEYANDAIKSNLKKDPSRYAQSFIDNHYTFLQNKIDEITKKINELEKNEILQDNFDDEFDELETDLDALKNFVTALILTQIKDIYPVKVDENTISHLDLEGQYEMVMEALLNAKNFLEKIRGELYILDSSHIEKGYTKFSDTAYSYLESKQLTKQSKSEIENFLNTNLRELQLIELNFKEFYEKEKKEKQRRLLLSKSDEMRRDYKESLMSELEEFEKKFKKLRSAVPENN